MNLENIIINQECIICLDPIDDKQLINLNEIDIFPKDCEHKNNYHPDCINKWIIDCNKNHISPSCPLCRNQLNEIIINIPDEATNNRPVIQITNNNNNNINNINDICKACQLTCICTVSLMIIFAMFVPHIN